MWHITVRVYPGNVTPRNGSSGQIEQAHKYTSHLFQISDAHAQLGSNDCRTNKQQMNK